MPPRVPGAEYMEWAKQVPLRARYSLASSGIRPVTREEFPLPEDIELCGRNEYGDERLRAGLGARYGVSAERCLLAEGASMANLLLSAATLQPGDRVLVETPGYEPILRGCELLGARPTPLPRRFEDGFAVDEEALERELARGGVHAVWLTNLHNPSGTSIPHQTLRRIYERVERAGAWLLVGETYLGFLPGEPSAALLGPRALIASSFTKVLGLPGIRIGWAIGDPEALARARRLHGILSAQTAFPSVCIALAALPRMEGLLERARAIALEGRTIFGAWLADHPQIREVRPAAGLISFPRLPEGTDDRALVERLLQEYETVAAPGSYFEGPGHLRIGVGAPAEELSEALRRLARALGLEREPGTATAHGIAHNHPTGA